MVVVGRDIENCQSVMSLTEGDLMFPSDGKFYHLSVHSGVRQKSSQWAIGNSTDLARVLQETVITV